MNLFYQFMSVLLAQIVNCHQRHISDWQASGQIKINEKNDLLQNKSMNWLATSPSIYICPSIN